MNVDQTIQRALRNLDAAAGRAGELAQRLRRPDVPAADVGGAGLRHAGACPTPQRTARLLTYFTNVQRPDGSIGLHAESTSGSMFTSTLSYVAMRLLGVPRRRRAHHPAAGLDPRATAARSARRRGASSRCACWGCTTGRASCRCCRSCGCCPRTRRCTRAGSGATRAWCTCRWPGSTARSPPRPTSRCSRALRDELYQGRYEGIDWEAQREVVASGRQLPPRDRRAQGRQPRAGGAGEAHRPACATARSTSASSSSATKTRPRTTSTSAR